MYRNDTLLQRTQGKGEGGGCLNYISVSSSGGKGKQQDAVV
jgi:hypothetical protein